MTWTEAFEPACCVVTLPPRGDDPAFQSSIERVAQDARGGTTILSA